MTFPDIIGATGVSLLLIAFLLSSFRIIQQKSLSYIVLNIVGASLACYASILINFLPFVVLEAAWAIVAIISLIRSFAKKKE